MAQLTPEEREELEEKKELEREEKRRAAQQKRLEAESEARKAAVKAAAKAFKNKSVITGRNIKKKTEVYSAAVVKKTSASVKTSINGLKKFIDKLDLGFYSIQEAFSRFAEKKISLPLLFLISMGSYLLITLAAGYEPFGLIVHLPTMQFYVCDFSVGLCSRLLVGAVIGLFKEKVSVQLMSLIINTATIGCLILQSVFAAAVLRKAMRGKCLSAFLLGLAFILNPLVTVEYMSAPGLLDVYLLALFLIWLCVYKTPLVGIVTPIFCLIGMAIHYEFLFAYLPPMLTILLYRAFCSEKKSTRICNGITFTVSSGVSATSFFYFVLFAKDHLKMTSDEFYAHMLGRFDITVAQREGYTAVMGAPLFRDYFDYYIFGEYKGQDYFENIGDFFAFLKNWTKNGFNAGMLRKDMALFLPIFLFCVFLWCLCIRQEKGAKKIPYICFIGQALVLVPELIISTDIWRWVAAALISQFAVFFAVYLEKNAVLHSVLAEKPFTRRGVRFAAVPLFLIYAVYGFTLL